MVQVNTRVQLAVLAVLLLALAACRPAEALTPAPKAAPVALLENPCGYMAPERTRVPPPDRTPTPAPTGTPTPSGPAATPMAMI